MKKNSLLFFFLFLFGIGSNFCLAQWQNVNPNFSSPTEILAVSVVSNQVIWLAAKDTSSSANGNVFARSVNGGNSWNHFSIAGFNNFIPANINSLNADTAWVAMYNNAGGGGIFRTNNGGTSWAQQTTALFAAPNGFPNFVHFFNANNGVCMGNPSNGFFEIYTSSNGGNNWSRVAQTNIPTPLSGEFGIADQYTVKGNTIYFRTNLGRIYSSRNAGLNWTVTNLPIYNNESMLVGWIAAKNANEALAIGFNANNSTLAIYQTNNGGLTWTFQTGGNNGSSFKSKGAYVPLTETEGYYMLGLNNSNFVFKSFNNGLSWNQQTIPLVIGNEGTAGTAAGGELWIAGTYLDSANSGLIKLTKSSLDIMPLGVQINGGKTNCFTSSDSLQVKIFNNGTSTINLSSSNVLNLEYEFYSSIPGGPISGPFVRYESVSSGSIPPSQTSIINYAGTDFNFARNNYIVSVKLNLSGASPGTSFNDVSTFTDLKTGASINVLGNLFPTRKLAKGMVVTLQFTGKFTTIQWQSSTGNGVWANESGFGSNQNLYKINVSTSKYYRALTCGNILSDSIFLPVAEIGNEIGRTFFDLQTNGSVDNRIKVYNDKVSAVFTGSFDSTRTSFADRGSFYNFKDGNTWGALPLQRIEQIRTGWPSLLVTQTGKELIVSHDAAAQKLVSLSRPIMGSGAWLVQTDSLVGMWPKIACSNGDTVHVICLDIGTSSAAKIRYYRSVNGGLNWDIKTDLPGYTVANGFASTFADAYAIAAKGKFVALAVGGFNNRLVLYKSNDGGLTWNTKTVKSFPAGFNGNTLLPATETTDGAVSLTIDSNNIAHLVTGKMVLEDFTADDNAWGYYPNTDGLLYWNESFASDSLKTIASASLANLIYTGEAYNFTTAPNTGNYGLASMASINVNKATNELFVTFVSPTNYSADEGHGKDKRDVFGLMSPNAGLTWSNPQNFTQNQINGMDNIYPSTFNNQDGKVHMMWLASPFVKQIVGSNSSISQILYDTIPYSNFESIDVPILVAPNNICNITDSILLKYKAIGSFASLTLQARLNGGTPINLISFANNNKLDSIQIKLPNSLIKGLYTFRIIANTGKQSAWSNAKFINPNPIKPTIQNIRPLIFCNGDSTLLRVDTLPAGATNLTWFVNDSVFDNNWGYYGITIKNSALVEVQFLDNGCLVKSDTIRVTKVNLQALIVKMPADTNICLGSELQLQATVLSGMPFSYSWKKEGIAVGNNAIVLNLGSVTENTTGNYTIDITNVCGVYQSNPVFVKVIKVPQILKQPQNTAACIGRDISFIITAKPGDMHQSIWRKSGVILTNSGDTLFIPNVAYTDTGSYTCTLINSCGSVLSDEVKLSIIPEIKVAHTLKDTLVCSGNELRFTANATGGNVFYLWMKDTLEVSNSNELFFPKLMPSNSGNYFLKAGNECGVFTSTPFEIRVLEAPSLFITVVNDTLFVNITGAYETLQWYRNDVLIAGATNNKLHVLTGGNYQVWASAASGCISKSALFPFTPAGLNQLIGPNQIQLFPNPASDKVYIKGTDLSQTTLHISDVLGRVWIVNNNLNSKDFIDVSFLPNGLYHCSFQTPNASRVISIVINR